MNELRTSEKRTQTAYNAYRSVRRRFETLQIQAGETTAFGILTMANTGRGRRKIVARVIRESDWRLIMELICVAWFASPESDNGRELLISDAVNKLSYHLHKRHGKRHGQ